MEHSEKCSRKSWDFRRATIAFDSAFKEIELIGNSSRLFGCRTQSRLLLVDGKTDACFMKSPSSFRDAAKYLSAEFSELIACGVPPLDILIGDFERKASIRGRDDQFLICSGSPHNVRTWFS